MTMSLEIPRRLRKLLNQDPSLERAVSDTLTEFEPWIEGSGLPFFPEYTDHGPRHLVQVMRTAEALINGPAWKVLTPGDAAALIIAVLLHDCAMHLREDGFVQLVTARRDPVIPHLDERRWSSGS